MTFLVTNLSLSLVLFPSAPSLLLSFFPFPTSVLDARKDIKANMFFNQKLKVYVQITGETWTYTLIFRNSGQWKLTYIYITCYIHIQLFHVQPFTHNSFTRNFVTHISFTHRLNTPTSTHTTLSHTHTHLFHTSTLSHANCHTHTTLSAFPILLSHLFCAYWKKLTYGVLRSFNFAGFHHSFGSPKWCVLGPPWSTVVLRGERWTQPLAGCLASASRWGRPETPRWGTQILADA